MKDMPDQRHCDKVNDGRGESKEDFTYFYTCYYITKTGCEIWDCNHGGRVATRVKWLVK